jgi:hypothetical protein
MGSTLTAAATLAFVNLKGSAITNTRAGFRAALRPLAAVAFLGLP